MEKHNSVFDYHKRIWKESKKETNKYYSSNIQEWGSDMIGAIFTAAILSVYLYFRNGMSIDWLGTFLSVVVGFSGSVLFRYLHTVWEYYAKSYQKIELEAEKYNWNNVLIDIDNYKISGYGKGKLIRVKNDKPMDCNLRVRMEIIQVFVDGIKTLGNAGRSLQHIDDSLGDLETRIHQCYFVSPPIQKGHYSNFVITRETKDNSYEFDTYPTKDISLPFGDNHFPEVIVKVEIQGNIEIGNENFGLSHLIKKYLISSNGKIEEYKN